MRLRIRPPRGTGWNDVASNVVMRLLIALVLCAATCAGEVRLNLSTVSGRTTFYLGEGIELKLAFEAQEPGAVLINQGGTSRATLVHPLDEFRVTPEDGAVDPFRVLFVHEQGMGWCSPMFQKGVFEVREFLNEWVSLRKPGKYAVSVKSKRAVRAADGKPGEAIPLESGPIEIEIVEPPRGLAAETLAKAREELESGLLARAGPRWLAAERTLRYLETPEAARTMAEISAKSQEHALTRGLWTTPHRRVVIDAMEEWLAAPEVGVTSYWLRTLVLLGVSSELPNVGPVGGSSREYGQVFARHAERYHALLLRALPKKQTEARIVTAMTLQREGAPIAPESLREILISAPAATAALEYGLFTDLWPVIASPEIGPFVEQAAFAKAGSPEGSSTRMQAVRRLYEIDPERARRRVLEEIKSGTPVSPTWSQFILYDRELPELDEFFNEKLEGPNPPWNLISRYATRTALPAVLAALDRPGGRCSMDGLVYLLRVAPDEGRLHLEAMRASGSGCRELGISGDPRDRMSEALEDVLIGDLGDADSQVSGYAVMVLGRSGTARAEPHLWQLMEKWRASLGDRPAELNARQRGVEQGFTLALLNSWGWTLTPDRLDRFEKLCVSDDCRTSCANARKSLVKPVQIHFNSSGDRTEFMIGGHTVTVPARLRERIQRYPRGTVFTVQLPHRESWYIGQLERQLREMFDLEGLVLRIEDQRQPAL